MRIALIGNCQVQTWSVVAPRLLDLDEVRVLDYSTPDSRDDATRARFADRLAEVDLIFCQTALLSHTNERELRARHGAKVVTIANFHFRGLFPDSCTIGDFAHRLTTPTGLHSVLVLDAFRRGLSPRKARRAFALENFARLGLLDAWSSSMAEMRRREANAVVDVPAAEFMQDACRRYPAFLTMNHPGAPMLTEYLRRVFRHAGLTMHPFDPTTLPDPLGAHDTTPILDEVAEYFRLPYRTRQVWRINALGPRELSRKEYVQHACEAYRRADPATLKVHSPTDLVATLRATHSPLVD